MRRSSQSAFAFGIRHQLKPTNQPPRRVMSIKESYPLKTNHIPTIITPSPPRSTFNAWRRDLCACITHLFTARPSESDEWIDPSLARSIDSQDTSLSHLALPHASPPPLPPAHAHSSLINATHHCALRQRGLAEYGNAHIQWIKGRFCNVALSEE